MDEQEIQTDPGVICVRCGHLNDVANSRCSSCRVPMDDFASTAPWEMGTARPAAYAPTASPRTKPIIFWGVILYFGPSVLGVIYFLGLLVIDLINGETSYLQEPGYLAITLFSLLYGCLSAWAVWSVCKGYFGKTPKDS